MRILIVEDSPEVAECLGIVVENLGWNSEIASTADNAITRLCEASYDATIIDLCLPDAEGSRSVRWIRRLFPDLPIVAITAGLTTEQTCLEAGADAFLAKPFMKDDLYAAVIKATERRRNNASPGNPPV